MQVLSPPKPIIKARKVDLEIEAKAVAGGLNPLLARIIAGRSIAKDSSIDSIIKPTLGNLTPPSKMADMAKAAARIVQAIIKGEIIGLETDHDCDGQTSHAVFYRNLVTHFNHPEAKIKSYIGNRLTEGYGLSDSLCKRILEDNTRVDLLITADNGSSDEARIAILKEEGIEVIVTDHHVIPADGYPRSAYACLNPTREDCGYGDPYIAGCMVAWLLMTQVRIELINAGVLPKDAPKLSDTLDYVAVGTIADCVSIAKSTANRAVVNYGIKLIQRKIKPCWEALRSIVTQEISAEDISFVIGPLLNSDGRLDTALNSVSFLLSKDITEANLWIKILQESNKKRKEIQKDITRQGTAIALQQMLSLDYTLCIYLESGHSGVHGISASRIKDTFGRPTVFLTTKVTNNDIITGSIRGIEGFNVRKALQHVVDKSPNIFLSFGGHSGAGGVTLEKTKLEEFSVLFEAASKIQLEGFNLNPIVWTDGEISGNNISFTTIDNLKSLQPFGREFEEPVFQAKVIVNSIKPIGDGTHARLMVTFDNKSYRAVWFQFRDSDQDPFPVNPGELLFIAFAMKDQVYQGVRQYDLRILAAAAI